MRRWETAAGMSSRAAAISDSVVWRPRLKRMLARAWSAVRLIAVSTCDGSIAPDEIITDSEAAVSRAIEWLQEGR